MMARHATVPFLDLAASLENSTTDGDPRLVSRIAKKRLKPSLLLRNKERNEGEEQEN
jgi:hypothetical protein